MPVPDQARPEVTVVVVTWQGAHLLRPCLRSLRAQHAKHNLLVVDNASTDGTSAMVAEEFPEARVLRLESNTGFAGGVAAALDQVTTRFVALLNNDATADPGWLAASIATITADHEIAAVTSRMLFADRASEVNNAGVVLLRSGYGADRGMGQPDGPSFDLPTEVFGFSGGAAVLRTLAVGAVGGMDPRFFLYYEDTDLSWRLRLAGWKVSYCPTAVVHHQHAASSDTTSRLFAFYNERNRMLTLLRCAPLRFASAKILRFMLTTGSLALKRLTGRQVSSAEVFSTTLRLKVLYAAARSLPWALRSRADITSRSKLRRRTVLARWVGRDDLNDPVAAG